MSQTHGNYSGERKKEPASTGFPSPRTGPAPHWPVPVTAPDHALLDLAAELYLYPPGSAVASLLPRGFFPHPESLIAALHEYHTLFFQPRSPLYLAAFESVQREGRWWGPVTYRVAELYTACGFDPAQLSPESGLQRQRIPDHLGLELSFLSFLLRCRENALQEGSPSGGTSIDQVITYFRREHLSQWAPRFGLLLEQRAGTLLYRFLGRLTAILSEEIS